MTTSTYQHAQRGNVSPDEWSFTCVVLESLSRLPNAPFGIVALSVALESDLFDCACPPGKHVPNCAAHQLRKDVVEQTEQIMLNLIRGAGRRMRGQS